MVSSTIILAIAAKKSVEEFISDIYGITIGDKLKEFRKNNLAKIMIASQKDYESRNRCQPPKDISEKLSYIFIDKASIEPDANLQYKWSKLLANALDSQNNTSESASIIAANILAQLIPSDANLLNYIRNCYLSYVSTSGNNGDEFAFKCKLDSETTKISLNNLYVLGLINGATTNLTVSSKFLKIEGDEDILIQKPCLDGKVVILTARGKMFLEAIN